MSLRLFCLALLHAVTTTVFAAPCVLTRDVLVPYKGAAAATEEQWRDSRRAVMDFTYCQGEIDRESRRVFFEVVNAEFEADHQPALARWNAKRPGSEALYDAIRIYDHRLKELMDAIVTPADREFSRTILSYGNAKAIAGLGPAVKSDVLRQLGKPRRVYGIAKQYDAQLEALGALGYWIEPANRSFTAVEKESLLRVLTSLLDISADVRNGAQARKVEAAMRALAHSDAPAAAAAIRAWMAKQSDHSQPLYSAAAKALESIDRNAMSRGTR